VASVPCATAWPAVISALVSNNAVTIFINSLIAFGLDADQDSIRFKITQDYRRQTLCRAKIGRIVAESGA
jgi:hypothetical protein